MKRLIATVLASALVLPMVPAAAQEHHDNRPDRPATERGPDSRPGQNASDRGGDNRAQPSARSSHRFKKGEKFNRARATHYARLNHRQHRALSAPPRGYVWVRAGDDALLVRLSNNVISRVVFDVF